MLYSIGPEKKNHTYAITHNSHNHKSNNVINRCKNSKSIQNHNVANDKIIVLCIPNILCRCVVVDTAKYR